jgi:hypothetical protein
MIAARIDHPTYAPAQAAWLEWRPDSQWVRWIAIAAAAGCTWVAGEACRGPILINTSHLHLAIENPLKLLLAAVVALQMWCLFTPRIHSVAARWLRRSLWYVMAILGGVESGALAVVGILAIDLRWKSASIWTSPSPTQSATISFLLFAAALTSTDPRSYLHMAAWRCGVQWNRWNWRARVILIFFCCNVALMCNSLCAYWRHASTMFLVHDALTANTCDQDGKLQPNFDNFCKRCREQIPLDARILYHGPNEGLVLAYVIYPRRVFMLPGEQRDMFHECWRRESWCQGMTADPLDAYWKWDPSMPNISEEQFIADRRVTYVVTFDETDVKKNSIQALR